MLSTKRPFPKVVLIFLTILGVICPAGIGWALQIPTVFSSHMVLQRDMPIPVWGWAEPGETITVSFRDTSVKATADADGRWRVDLPAIPAGGPYTMTIVGKETITIEDILIGEVWICSGQSNMEMGIEMIKDSKEEVANADYPNIRLFHVDRCNSGTEKRDIEEGKWLFCLTRNIKKDGWGGFSALGYFFGRRLHKKLEVPVGLIDSSWGGSMIEPWTPPVGFEQVPALSKISEEIHKAPEQYQQLLNETLAQYEQWLAQAKEAVASQKEIPQPPKWPEHPLAGWSKPTSLYNGMIHPLVPFAIRGAIWYQGESNCVQKDGMIYYDKMKALIEGWRTVWNEGDFPFYYVQLAPFDYLGINLINDPTELPRLWEAQIAALAIPNTGMAVTIDLVDNLKDIHPANKQDVGERLALWALAKTYGFDDIVYSGPLYKCMAVEGDKIRIQFDHIADRLTSRDGKSLTWFQIAGKNKQFYDAVAQIAPDLRSILVHCEAVPHPVAIRFAWDQLAQPNLANSAGLPASPFRTDNW